MLLRLLRPAPPKGPLLALHAAAVLATHVVAGALLVGLAAAAASGALRERRREHAGSAGTPEPPAGANVLDV